MECDCSPVADGRYDSERNRSPAEAVVRTVAAASNVEPIALPPLAEHVDTDALNRLVREPGRTDGGSPMVFGFCMHGWNVFVRADGRIRVCDPTGPASPSPVFD
jgi:hypothetical protein